MKAKAGLFMLLLAGCGGRIGSSLATSADAGADSGDSSDSGTAFQDAGFQDALTPVEDATAWADSGTGLQDALTPVDDASDACGACDEPEASTDYALQFDGQSFVRVSDAPSLRSSEMTIEAWCLFSGTGGDYNTIVAKPVGSATEDSFAIWYQEGVLMAGINASSPTGAAQYPWSPDSSWHYVAYTYSTSAQQQALYLDGAQVYEGGGGGTPQYDDQPLLLGVDLTSGQPTGFFNGTLDEVRIWSTARTQSEIMQDMALRTGGPAASLVAYWSFDEGQGQIAHDGSGEGNVGQLGADPGPDANDPQWVVSMLP